MPPGEVSSLNALHALKIAQRRLRPEVRNKLLSISSSRTGPDLAPDAWRFVFLDPGTSGHCRVVTVAAKTSSEHPDTVEAFSSARSENDADLHPIPQNKLLVNSDQALEKIRGTSKLKGLHAAECRLVQTKGYPETNWIIQLFSDGPEPVARFRVGAKTGKVEQLPPGK
jgi:hypothetical protein